jgi:signal transduction histidine kinase
MLRVLAGIGLSIGEFVHEIRQFSPIFQSEMAVLSKYANTDVLKNSVNGLGKNFEQFRTFAAYFDETIRNNAKRELIPIDIRDVVQDFLKIIQRTAEKNQVEILPPQYDGYDLFTCPMHPSEWASILFNLYSNANKATIKARVKAKILIQAKEENNRIVFEFCDNGTGIPDSDKERIFTAFFTTSTPVGLNASQNEELIGSGLGLKIISDIIESYEGEIFVSNPPDGFKTCIRIELPKATDEQIKEQVNDDLFST